MCDALIAAQKSGDKNIAEFARYYNGKDALHSRLKGIIDIDVVVGQRPYLKHNEDQILVRFIKSMAKYGFGYYPQTLK